MHCVLVDVCVENVLHDNLLAKYVVFFPGSLCGMFPITFGLASRMQVFWCLLFGHQSVINTSSDKFLISTMQMGLMFLVPKILLAIIRKEFVLIQPSN